MLGLTLECARCHDHKFDPITQRDYYSLFAFFNNIDESGLYSHFTDATPTPSLLLWPDAAGSSTSWQARIAAAEAALTAIARGATQAFDARRAGPFDRLSGGARSAARADRAPGVRRGRGRQDAGQRAEVVGAGCRTGWWSSPAGAPGGSNAALDSAATTLSSIPACRPFVRTDPFSLAFACEPTERQDRAVDPASVARVDRRRQPRLRADARSRPAVLRPHPLLAGQRHRGAREDEPLPLDAWSRRRRHLRRIEPRRRHQRSISTACRSRPRSCATICTRTSPTPRGGRPIGGQRPLTIGARFRDSGFKNGLIDDLQVFDVALTAAEVSGAIRLDSPRCGRVRALPGAAASAVHRCGRRAAKPCASGEPARRATFPRSW